MGASGAVQERLAGSTLALLHPDLPKFGAWPELGAISALLGCRASAWDRSTAHPRGVTDTSSSNAKVLP